MISKIAKILIAVTAFTIGIGQTFAVAFPSYYLEAVITMDSEVEVKKSTIFDASNSFLSDPDKEYTYEWDFGDGNRNEGVEVLHAYQEPGHYTVGLIISDGENSSETKTEVFAYKKLILLLTDQTEAEERIKINQEYAKENGVYLKVVESFGSHTEFISEEILSKKLPEQDDTLKKAQDIIIWTKENAGLNALSRYLRTNTKEIGNQLKQKNIFIIDEDVKSQVSSLERQYQLLQPKKIIIVQEGAINALIKSETEQSFFQTLKERGNSYAIVDSESGKIRPWNFMSYFVNVLINNGIPDNTIALLLLLPVIATVVAFMRQVIGITTFGIYTPTIITLSFLIIGMYTGLLTLLAAIIVGSISRVFLKKIRMLFIPKMAIVLTLISLSLLLLLIASIYLDLFDAAFLSIAIFPMLILSTLVEKFVSAKSEKSLWSASFLMGETLLVAIVAYFVAGGEINLGFGVLKFEFIKSLLLNYPETVFLFIIINIVLGKWTGLRVLERIRFREILRNIEE